MKNVCVILFVLMSTLSLAQYKNYNTENAKWYKGELVLNNGDVLEGDVVYNFVDGSLKLKTEEEELFYTTRKVSQFSLTDSLGSVNKYFTLLYDFKGVGNTVPYFFKVLYENNYIAILSKKQFEFKKKKPIYSAGINNFFVYLRLIQYIETIQENIYIADISGRIFHFLGSNKVKSSSYELDFDQMIFYNSKEVSKNKQRAQFKYHIERGNALDLIFGDYQKDVDKFIKKSNLDVKNVSDLVKVCDFYSKLQDLNN